MDDNASHSGQTVQGNVTNAALKQELAAQAGQLGKLWDLNTAQTRQLAKLEDVPQKLDQLLQLNINLATLSQQGLQQERDIAELKKRADEANDRQDKLDHKVTARFNYYAGALAVGGLVMGGCLWLAQQAITSAFTKIAETDHAIGELHGDVDLLKFKVEPKSK